METTHRIIFGDACNLSSLPDESIHLAITSPPYPMIEMWDELFINANPDIESALASNEENNAFELMHRELDKVWHELHRILCEGGFACINVGDATRKIGDRFQLHPNHARIITACQRIGFDVLPFILWKKTTNAPNKFMGSGMLPAGAYVTLEHEYVLIFRKRGKRAFSLTTEKRRRNESALFWEERNRWFSDVWELKGVAQEMGNTQSRRRSGAFPLELAYRLVNMYSLQEDTVIDPFLGTGTTTIASIACGRNSVGIEIDPHLETVISSAITSSKNLANCKTIMRIEDHMEFVSRYTSIKGDIKHRSVHYGFPVITKQERGMKFYVVELIQKSSDSESFHVTYAPLTINPIEDSSSYPRISFPCSIEEQMTLFL